MIQGKARDFSRAELRSPKCDISSLQIKGWQENVCDYPANRLLPDETRPSPSVTSERRKIREESNSDLYVAPADASRHIKEESNTETPLAPAEVKREVKEESSNDAPPASAKMRPTVCTVCHKRHPGKYRACRTCRKFPCRCSGNRGVQGASQRRGQSSQSASR